MRGLVVLVCLLGGCEPGCRLAEYAFEDRPDAKEIDLDGAARCGTGDLFEVRYIDWDSTEDATVPIIGAEVRFADGVNGANTDESGYAAFCRANGQQPDATLHKTDYVPALLSARGDRDEPVHQPYGITEARLATFLADDLGGKTWDPTTALVAIVVRGDLTSKQLDGVTITLHAYSGPTLPVLEKFHRVSDGTWAPGATTDGGASLIVFLDVPVRDDLSVSFSGPEGAGCRPPSMSPLTAGELFIATVFCNE